MGSGRNYSLGRRSRQICTCAILQKSTMSDPTLQQRQLRRKDDGQQWMRLVKRYGSRKHIHRR
jgi:hypothetical protein